MFNRSSLFTGLSPSGGGNLPSRRLWGVLTLAGLTMIGLVVLYALEIKHLQRTLEVGRLLGISAGIGLLIGAVVAYFLQRFGSDATERLQIGVAVVLFFVLFSPLFASLTNRGLGPREVERTEFLFFAENPYAQRFGIQEGQPIEPDGYYFFVLSQGEMLRFPIKESMGEGLVRGDTLKLELRRGLWGYRWLPSVPVVIK